MAFVVTDEEWLNRLNEDARSKKDRKLNFSIGPFQSFDQFIKDTYGGERPYQTGNTICIQARRKLYASAIDRCSKHKLGNVVVHNAKYI
ncbi:unnamed protein product [Trichobilharzia szidati]|nr:unnamed protein product [Trichobilharzia szidati]